LPVFYALGWTPYQGLISLGCDFGVRRNLNGDKQNEYRFPDSKYSGGLVANFRKLCHDHNETFGETKMRKAVLVGVVGLGLLTGCGLSDEEMAAAKAARYQADVSNAAERCASFGFVRNTQAFSSCVQITYNNLVTERRMETAERNLRSYNGWKGVRDAGRALQGNKY
tara:strand:+ start:135 stop:638 length:504 start_codon:yes stop_codon:yes gene_type:complete